MTGEQAAGQVRPLVPPTMDALDRRIVRLLQTNGRLTNTDIGRALDVTETTIRKRMGRLIEAGLIQILAVPTESAIGPNVSAIIGVSVELPHVDEVARTIREMPEARFVGVSVGRYDIVMEMVVSDQAGMLDFLHGKLGHVPGITGIETSMILRTEKWTYEWELPLEVPGT